METRFKVYQRGNGIYYIQDVVTNQQESLRTRDKKKALALLAARKVWPAFRTKKGIPIALEQHRRLVDAEQDEEFARYLEVLWETGGAQTNIACLHRDNTRSSARVNSPGSTLS